jgi:hypothetical protein
MSRRPRDLEKQKFGPMGVRTQNYHWVPKNILFYPQVLVCLERTELPLIDIQLPLAAS